MSVYLTFAEFRGLTVMPAADVDWIEATYPGWIDIQIRAASNWIDAQLVKRYAAPFAEPYPVQLLQWTERIVTPDAYLKRGVNPNDLQYEEIKQRRIDARSEIQQAADQENGLYELPLNAAATRVGKGGPLFYSEASPYVWMDEQVQQGRCEDRSGIGTEGGFGG